MPQTAKVPPIGIVEIPPSEWSSYLDSVSRALANAKLSIEVESNGRPRELVADQLALQFLAYDGVDQLFEVAGTAMDSRAPNVIRHLVEAPRRIVADGAGELPSQLEIEDGNGERTIIKLSNPEEAVSYPAGGRRRLTPRADPR